MNRVRHTPLTVFFWIALLFSICVSAQIEKLKVSDNNRFLVKENGKPFVWIGETNWFFAKLRPTVIDSILDTRSAQGFTVMFVSCREEMYNGAGPGSINNPNEAWWSYLDQYIAKCEKRNLYVGIALGWWGVTKNNNERDLYNFGKWVGNRYRDKNNIVWLTLGEAGSHSRKSTLPDNKINSLVKGIRDGDTGDKLLTVHADFKRGTSLSNDGDLCDFNNWQTGQWCCLNDLPRKDERTWTVWEAIDYDYHLRYNGKPKPTLDSEAWYELNKDFCGTTPFNIRRRAYFTIFAGAFGHTYGAGGIWDGLDYGQGCSSSAANAIQHEGAKNIGYLSQLLHSLGSAFLKLRPNQSFILDGNSDNYDTHIQATIANDGTFALVYSASDASYTLDLTKLSTSNITHIWFSPRTGEYLAGKGSSKPKKKNATPFDPPGDIGAGNDWVLILGGKRTIKKFAMN